MEADLVDVVEQLQGDDPTPSAHTDDVPTSSSQAASRAPSSSRSTAPLGAIVVPLSRVQKLEDQMAILLRHVRPWMQKLIAEFEARMERMMERMMDQKVQAINKCNDAFELRVLERPAPTKDLSSFLSELASLRADVDAILPTPAVEPQATSTALSDDTVLEALFSGDAKEQTEPTCARGKRHRSKHLSEATEDERAKKRQHKQEKQAKRASIIDEQLRQERVRESVVGASSSMPISDVSNIVVHDMSITYGAVRMIDSTTEGGPNVAVAGFGKPDPPAC
uniref:Integrase core domain containing protein n=1 Tax=Solanum tuberosum TaxID=4113 RepID=M1DLF1_SOLTU